MNADEIRNSDTLERWLAERPRADALCISQRAALRVFPFWADAMNSGGARQHDLTALPVLRALLIPGPARKCPAPEVTSDANANAAVAFAVFAKSAAAAARAASNNAASVDAVTGSAASAAAYAALSAAAFTTSAADAITPGAKARAAAWTAIRTDALTLRAGNDPTTTPLWPTQPPSWFTEADTRARAIWARETETWSFWLRWWDGILAGKPLDWALQRDVALIPDKDWQKGPAHIAGLIADIERSHSRSSPRPDPVAEEFAALSPAEPATVERVRIAITANRDALPPTFDAIGGFIALEIERLQKINYTSDEHAEECRRQIAVLCILDSAISRMRAAVPAEGAVTKVDAEKVEKLSRVYARHFAEWPRANAGDLVDSAYRGGLVGATVALGALCGFPLTHALAAGIVLFGGKKIADAFKAAKDATK